MWDEVYRGCAKPSPRQPRFFAIVASEAAWLPHPPLSYPRRARPFVPCGGARSRLSPVAKSHIAGERMMLYATDIAPRVSRGI